MTVSFDVNLRRRLWSDDEAAPVLRAARRAGRHRARQPGRARGRDRRPTTDDPAALARAVLDLGPSIGRREARRRRRAGPPARAASPISSPALRRPVGRRPGRCRRRLLRRVHRGASRGRRTCRRPFGTANACGAAAVAAVGDLAGLPDPRRARAAARGRRSGHDPLTVRTEAEALALDAADPLSAYRDRFLLPDGPEGPGGPPAIYLAGNSLGLQAKAVRPAMEAQLDRWAHLGVEGWFEADGPWFTYDETFREPMARIVGARPSEVADPQHADGQPAPDAGLVLPPGRRAAEDPHRRAALPLRPARARQPPRVARAGPRQTDLVVVEPRIGRGARSGSRTSRRAIAEHGPSLALVAARRRQLRDRPGPPGRAADRGRPRGRRDRRLAARPCGRQRAARAARRRRRLRRLVHVQVPERRPGLGRVDLRPRAPHTLRRRRPAPDRLVGRDARPSVRPDRTVRRRHGRRRLEDVDRRRCSTWWRWRRRWRSSTRSACRPCASARSG